MLGNGYLTEAAPWTAIKTDPARAGTVVNVGLNLVALFARLSSPFIPFAAASIAEAIGEESPAPWPASGEGGLGLPKFLEAGRVIRAPEVLFRKVENEQVEAWRVRFGGREAG